MKLTTPVKLRMDQAVPRLSSAVRHHRGRKASIRRMVFPGSRAATVPARKRAQNLAVFSQGFSAGSRMPRAALSLP